MDAMLVRLRGLLGDFELRRRTLYEAADLQPVQLEPELVARMLRVALIELPDYQLRGLLRDIDDLGERLDEPALIDCITRSLGRGDLILVREQHAGISPGDVEPPEEEDDDDVIERLDWIEVLVEDEDHNPVPNVAYKIVLPDGSARTGRTNQNGIVRYDNIPSGSCEFSLVELDADAWERV
jgi:hypothetical protein